MKWYHAICATVMLVPACMAPPEPADMARGAGPSEVSDKASASEARLMGWADLTGRPLPEPDRVLQIGPDPETDVVDLWLPDEEAPHPTVLMIHGGCWQKEIADRTLMNYAAAALREEGMAVWNIEYRGVDEPGGGYPGTFGDVARAVDALSARGPALGLDTSRVVAFGHSAGGHLALWAAARPNLPETSPLHQDDPFQLAAVVNSGGLADLEASADVTQPGCLADIMGTLTGAPSEARPDVFADTSPAELLPLGVRQINVNGTRDRIAPPELGRALTEKAEAAGDDARFVAIDATGHVELVSPGSLAFDMQTGMLKSLLGLDMPQED
ncbi:alpha/beta hydrolase [Henriciella sp.]|uniref:alpha/beta hydrolase family protein n=1 Tax=Henriciella sp. TaxID=1968823 RepID=UPI00261F854E|nr:alpha/beta hydrolase [Henriciella sp.]